MSDGETGPGSDFSHENSKSNGPGSLNVGSEFFSPAGAANAANAANYVPDSSATSSSSSTSLSTPTQAASFSPTSPLNGTSTAIGTSTAAGTSAATATSPATIIPTITVSTPPPTYTFQIPIAAPTLTPIPDTNYEQQAIESRRDNLLNQVNALPVLTGTITGTLVSGLTGGRITSVDRGLTLGMMQGVVPVTDTINVRITRPTFSQGDPRATRNGYPLAYTYELTATHLSNGQPVERFNKDVALVLNVDHTALRAAGVRGWPLQVYTYNEQHSYWEEVPTYWNPQTNQLIATTPHFSLYTVSDPFDKVNNYVPRVSNFEVDLQSGSASVQYPINVPAGPGGFGPKVSLSYNSGNVDRVSGDQQGTSSVGWGWSLSTSYIAASQHFFGLCGAGAVNPWTASIVMDGANGDLIKGTDGYWHTSNESFARIQYFSGGGRTSDWWEAWDKSGTHYIFDQRALNHDEYNRSDGLCWGANELTTYKWMLRRATDVNGNVINYTYWYQRENNTLSDVMLTTGRTRAVYPREIAYGADRGMGPDKVQVYFHIANRSIGGYNDISDSDLGSGLYQSHRIYKIDVNRRQPNTGNYARLRSYELTQDFSTILTAGTPPVDYRHLTLTGIIPRGNDDATQLPRTTFIYWQRANTQVQQDWGHLWWALNGYGGEVGFYYDAAGGNSSSSWYRRVRAKRVKDGLGDDPNSVHNVVYRYDYRGATTNNSDTSRDAAFANPLHVPAREFRGFAWVREQPPTGQVTDHYYSQDDLYKAKEWRTQTGKTGTLYDDMNTAPGSNGNWASGGVQHYQYPSGSGNWTWKLQQGSWMSRSAGVSEDGYEANARFTIRDYGRDPDRVRPFASTWKMVKDANNYWGLQIYSRWIGQYRYGYYGKVILKVNGVTSYHDLSIYSASQARPFLRELEPEDWYRVRLHTSPDGRFAVELHADYGTSYPHYVMLRSTDMVDNNGNPVPAFSPGGTWTFQHSVEDDGQVNGVPSYGSLIDEYSETRTIYSQSDTVYQDKTPLGAAPPNYNQWRVGLANNASGMNIKFVPVMETSTTLYGNLCCQPGQKVRSKTEYDYDAYGNQIVAKEHGDLGTTADDRTTHSDYTENTTKWVLGKIAWTNTYKTITGNNGGPNWMASRLYYYDNQPNPGVIPDTGRGVMTKATQRNILAGVESFPGSSKRFSYDVYGHVFQSYDPRENVTTTWYDNYYHSFPIVVQYPNGRSDSTLWDSMVDMPLQTTDVNGTTTQFRYDVFGRPRINWISSPLGYGSEAAPNDKYTFGDTGQQSLSGRFYISYEKRLGTQAGSNETTWQTRWFDGRGRTIQDLSPKDGANSIVVDTYYNHNGQAESKYLPYQVANSNPYAYITPNTSGPKVTNSYDPIGRLQAVTNPDYPANPASVTWYDYNWLLQTGVYDESNHWKSWQVADMYGRVHTVRELDQTGHQPSDVFTTYQYNALNQVEEIRRDAYGSNLTITHIYYDGLGRKSRMEDPDMGIWHYVYDAAGNLIEQRDSYCHNPDPNNYNCADENHRLFIRYDNMNRPIEKFYGKDHNTYNIIDVRYLYDNALGDADAMKSWGRMRFAEVTTAGGQEKANKHWYQYDARGMLVHEEVRADYYSNRTYSNDYTYDTGGRLTSNTYPNPGTRERVDLSYNSQGIGLPSRLSTNQSTIHPVLGADYNARGQMTSLDQGSEGPNMDRLRTDYGYDDTTTKRGWLTSMRVSATGTGTEYLNLTMGYYLNGNIQQVSQTTGGTNSPTFNNTYQYDGLDRLRQADSAGTNGNPALFPQETYLFDSLGRMTTRTIGGTPYNYSYGDGAHKDAPTAYMNNTYGYDANGNQTTRTNTTTGSTQTRHFDLEGRLWKIVEGNVTTEMVYDPNGQRLVKNVTVITPTPTATNTPTNTPTYTPTHTPTNTPTPTSTPACPVSTAPFYPHYTDLPAVNNGYVMNGQAPTSGGKDDPLTVDLSSLPSGTIRWYSDVRADTRFASGNYVFNVQVETCATSSSPDYVQYTLEYTNADGSSPVQIGSVSASHYASLCDGQPRSFTVTIAANAGQVQLANKRLRLTATATIGSPVIHLGSSTYLTTPSYYVCSGGGGDSASQPGAGAGAGSTSKPSGVTTITSSRTLYIGLYEEDITTPNHPTPPYTVYYSFGGKMVGMRRANQPDPSTNGQYRIAGDHLGSTSIIVDTYTGTGGPRVVQRQYHKPYGEVAYQNMGTGNSLTSIGYTGQRLDQDSGLMFYNARFYDPALSYFVSADSIGVDKGDPRTRNRYSYVLNNPLGNTDPSGHCTDPDKNSPEYKNGETCDATVRQLKRYGLVVVDPSKWELWQLLDIVKVIKRMMTKFGWNLDEWRFAMGIDTKGEIHLHINIDRAGGGYGGAYYYKGSNVKGNPDLATRNLVIEDTALGFNPKDPLDFQRVVAHELAHAWDDAWDGALSAGLVHKTGGYYTTDYYHAGGYPASKYGGSGKVSDNHNGTEDWAESVAAYIYPEYNTPGDNNYQEVWEAGDKGGRNRQVGMDRNRRDYVSAMAFWMKILAP